ncbi:MAG: hypothetical protein TQ35_0008115 [Candidatus Aramenus sulfurataquae]|jgi:hypothetical protein|uniref:Uncharacterized protein n=2 Tax=Candidatus Aramenus sulfurataquae TaxID=1326980 RepID=A0AAE3K5I4_9CREN|nr:hypothetical protein [Candidatus Aramenus sulfurataquae]
MPHYLEDYVKAGFNPSTTMVTCDLGKAFSLFLGKGKVKLVFVNSPKPYSFDAQVIVQYFSLRRDEVFAREVSLEREGGVSATTLRFVDVGVPLSSKLYDRVMEALSLNPLVVKGVVDNLQFTREDEFFGWGIGEGRANLTLKPSQAEKYCLIGELGELLALSVHNRAVLGMLSAEPYLLKQGEEFLESHTKVYRELGEVIRSREDEILLSEEVGLSRPMERLKGLKVDKFPVKDPFALRKYGGLMKDPFASPFFVVVVGKARAVEEVCQKAESLGLRSEMGTVQTLTS